MNHAITIGGLVGALLFIAALFCLGIGTITVFFAVPISKEGDQAA